MGTFLRHSVYHVTASANKLQVLHNRARVQEEEEEDDEEEDFA